MEAEALEAEHVYILMKKEYRISRNVRAEWYLQRINSIITIPKMEKLVSIISYVYTENRAYSLLELS